MGCPLIELVDSEKLVAMFARVEVGLRLAQTFGRTGSAGVVADALTLQWLAPINCLGRRSTP